MTEQDKQIKKLKKALETLTISVRRALDALDTAMKGPSTPERGSEVAKICNWLDMQNDSARFFVLGVDYRKDRKKKLSTERIHLQRVKYE